MSELGLSLVNPRSKKAVRRVRSRDDRLPTETGGGPDYNPFADNPKPVPKPKVPPKLPASADKNKYYAGLAVDAARGFAFIYANGQAAKKVQWDSSIDKNFMANDMRGDKDPRWKSINAAREFVAGVLARAKSMQDMSKYDNGENPLGHMIMDSMGFITDNDIVQSGTVIHTLGQGYLAARRLADYAINLQNQVASIIPSAPDVRKAAPEIQKQVSALAAPFITGANIAAKELTPFRLELLKMYLKTKSVRGNFSQFLQFVGSRGDQVEQNSRLDAERLYSRFIKALSPAGAVKIPKLDFHAPTSSMDIFGAAGTASSVQREQELRARLQDILSRLQMEASIGDQQAYDRYLEEARQLSYGLNTPLPMLPKRPGSIITGGYITGGSPDEDQLYTPPAQPQPTQIQQTQPPAVLNPTQFSGLENPMHGEDDADESGDGLSGMDGFFDFLFPKKKKKKVLTPAQIAAAKYKKDVAAGRLAPSGAPAGGMNPLVKTALIVAGGALTLYLASSLMGKKSSAGARKK